MFAGGLKRDDSASALFTGARNFLMAESATFDKCTLRAAPERIFLENTTCNAEQEKLDEPRHHGLAPFPLNHVDDHWLFAVGWNFTRISPTTPTRGLVPSP